MHCLILSSAHGQGDARLNRHEAYLRAQGHVVELVAYGASGSARFVASLRVVRRMLSERPDAVIVADPELFLLASVVGRTRGVTTVIDIHEDYAAAVSSRDWIPQLLKGLATVAARLNDRVSRHLAHVVVVAASELRHDDEIVVPNIPDPATFEAHRATKQQVVYVGDVTKARGAIDMAKLAPLVEPIAVVVVGRTTDSLAQEMRLASGGATNLQLKGPMPHAEAWDLAGGSIAGLCLLQPLPAYLEARATKLWEYCASGIPPIVTDLPGQRRMVNALDPGLVASSVDRVAETVRALSKDRERLIRLREDARQIAVKAWEDERPDLALNRAVSRDL